MSLIRPKNTTWGGRKIGIDKRVIRVHKSTFSGYAIDSILYAFIEAFKCLGITFIPKPTRTLSSKTLDLFELINE